MQRQATSTTLVPRPRIGVTSADDPAPDNYVAAVERCGGEAVILKNTPETIEADLAGLDGLVISGGSDIDPARYASKGHAETKLGEPERDEYELKIVRLAFERGIPTLAICRGMQIANVAWGGNLHQHLPDLVDGTVTHDDPARKFQAFPEHIVKVEANSLLLQLARSAEFATNASHHQCVDRVGDGLRVVARTSDGIVEALERPDATGFWLATQWHPERLLDVDEGRSQRIFDAFIGAARKVTAAKAQQLPV